MQLLHTVLGEPLQVQLSILSSASDHAHKNSEVLLTFTRAQIDAEPARIESAVENSGIIHGLPGGSDRKANVPAGVFEPARVVYVLAEVVILDLRCKVGRKIRCIEMGNLIDAASAFPQRFPHRGDIVSDGSDASDSSHNDSASHRFDLSDTDLFGERQA